MARAVLAAVLLVGCGASPLPTTLFHAVLGDEVDVDERAWASLIAARSRGSRGAVDARAPVYLLASAETASGAWLAWVASDTSDRADVAGVLVRAQRTALGLEAQVVGEHRGPAVRPVLRQLDLAGTRVLSVESSSAEGSIERSAWLYVERTGAWLPLDAGEGSAIIPLHRTSVSSIDERWEMVETLTATLESEEGVLLVREHATRREQLRELGDLHARALREIDRDRRLALTGLRLVGDRPSLRTATH